MSHVTTSTGISESWNIIKKVWTKELCNLRYKIMYYWQKEKVSNIKYIKGLSLSTEKIFWIRIHEFMKHQMSAQIIIRLFNVSWF
jgi:hypothetical protein